MKKKNIKPIIMSALLAVGFGTTSVSTSFALFTDKNNSSIEVTSGIVDTKMNISLYMAGSLDTNMSQITGTSYNFTNGGYVEVKEDNNSIEVSKLTPGDRVIVKVTTTNLSNVKTLQRLSIVKGSDALAQKLTLTVRNASTTGTLRETSAEYISNFDIWNPIAPAQNTVDGDKIYEFLYDIWFKNTNNEITARETGSDNAVQGLSTTFKFVQEAVQGNAKVPFDVTNTTQLQTYLQIPGADVVLKNAPGKTKSVYAISSPVAVAEGVTIRSELDSEGVPLCALNLSTDKALTISNDNVTIKDIIVSINGDSAVYSNAKNLKFENITILNSTGNTLVGFGEDAENCTIKGVKPYISTTTGVQYGTYIGTVGKVTLISGYFLYPHVVSGQDRSLRKGTMLIEDCDLRFTDGEDYVNYFTNYPENTSFIMRNCTITNGWVQCGVTGSALYENCTFLNSNGQNIRTYVPNTTFKNCTIDVPTKGYLEYVTTSNASNTYINTTIGGNLVDDSNFNTYNHGIEVD